MQWEIKSVLPPRRRATQTGGKKMSPQSSRERFFILQQSSVLVHLIRHFFTNTKCILFSVQIQHAMSFFIEVKFFSNTYPSTLCNNHTINWMQSEKSWSHKKGIFVFVFLKQKSFVCRQ